MKKFSFLFLLLLGGYFANAQQVDQLPQEWTLEECIEYAAQHNLQVKQSELDLLSSKVEVIRSKAALYPTLNSGAAFRYSVGRTIEPTTNEVVDAPITTHNYYLQSGVDLFNGFSKQNQIKQNKAAFQANEFELAAQKNEIALQIVTAYTNILFNRELLENAEAQLRASELQRDRTARQVEVGALAQASLYEIEAQVASNELAVTNAYNNLQLAQLNLKQLLQLPAQQPFEIVMPEVEIETAQEYPVSAEEVYDIAEDTQPIVLAADTRIKSREFGLQAAKGNLWPSLSAQANFGSNYSSFKPPYLPEDISYLDYLDFNMQRSVGLSLNIPIFNGLNAQTAVSRARIAQEGAGLQAKIVRQQLRQTIEQAALDVKSAALTYRSNLNQVRSLREAFRSVEQRFNLGASNAVDYNVAKTNLEVAESNLIRAKYDYVFKNKILDFYLNKPLSFD